VAKTTLPGQHLLLHQTWPNDCCLCSHEAKLRVMEAKCAKLVEAAGLVLEAQTAERLWQLRDALREWETRP